MSETDNTCSDTQSECESRLADNSSQSESQSQPSSSNPPSHTSSPVAKPKTTEGKIDVLLKATGDAPIMKKKKWAVDQTKKIGWIIEFIRKYLKCEPAESLFIYVNQSFAPSPDVEVGTLYDCFGSDGKLVLHYCRTQAWG